MQLNLQQGSQEWLAFRKNKIGASDAPIILGISPYKSAYELWLEKTGKIIDNRNTSSMKRGHELEPLIRQRYESLTGNLVCPTIKIHPENEWLMASLDGINFDGDVIIEIKTCNQETFEAALDKKPVDHHMIQMQVQLACCPEAKIVHYFCNFKDKFHLLEIDRRDITEEIEELKKFYICMIDKKPPSLKKNDHLFIEDKEFSETVDQWVKIQHKIKALADSEKHVREKLVRLSGNNNAMNNKIKLSQVYREGSVDYKSIPELQKVDLNDYRKPPVSYWKIMEFKDYGSI